MTRGLPAFADHPASFLGAQRATTMRGQVVSVVDGDTYDVVMDLGFRQYGLVTLRLLGADTPELKAADETLRVRAEAARQRASDLLLLKPVLVRSFKDKQTFGRYVADVWVPDDEALTALHPDLERLRLFDATAGWIGLASLLVAEGLAVVFYPS
jgi:micrococcal nuclease